MCTVILRIGSSSEWPLLLAANRDERLDRAWKPPGQHWPGQPDVIGGLDILGGGTWLAVGRQGMVAAVLNRVGSLGPAPDKRSRGELPLLALCHANPRIAANAMTRLDGTGWRSFNLVLANRDQAVFLRGTGQGRVTAHDFEAGTHVITAGEPDDPCDPRVARNLPRFRDAIAPRPPDWSSWPALLADNTPPSKSAIDVAPNAGFGTVSAALLGLGARAVFRTTRGSPSAATFVPVAWPPDWGW